jgi:hypothetical protein
MQTPNQNNPKADNIPAIIDATKDIKPHGNTVDVVIFDRGIACVRFGAFNRLASKSSSSTFILARGLMDEAETAI